MNPEPSLSDNLIRALEGLPRYLISYVVGFFIVAITDIIVTSLVIGCVLLGLVTSPLIALIAFFLIYTFYRTLNLFSNSLNSAGSAIASQINLVGQLIHQQNQQQD